MGNKTTFSANDLSFAYGDKPILRHLNFQIEEGKVTTLMGANGCGKSTLFHLLTKNTKLELGDVYLKGKNIDAITMKEFAREVAIVHQYNTAPDDITVEQLVHYGRTPYTKLVNDGKAKAESQRKVERAMKITGVLPYRERLVNSLSGGQKQRVWIAMALAQDTKILLLDEPTTYLDVRYQLQILRLIKNLNRKCGITVVMVLHDINQALAYSDEIVALSPKGELILQGRPEEVMVPEVLSQMYGIQLEVAEVNGHPYVLTI